MVGLAKSFDSLIPLRFGVEGSLNLLFMWGEWGLTAVKEHRKLSLALPSSEERVVMLKQTQACVLAT